MCLSANEPGGPRRCESFMKNVHVKMIELTQIREAMAAKQKLIANAEEQLSQLQVGNEQGTLTIRDEKSYNEMVSLVKGKIEYHQALMTNLEEDERSAHRALITAKANHDEEIERRKRMGLVVSEDGTSPIDETKPYATVSPADFEQIQNEIGRQNAAGNPIDFNVRKRMVPVKIDEQTSHPFITSEEIDIQFPQEGMLDRFRPNRNIADQPVEPRDWYAPTDKVLQAAYVVTDGGANYVSQKAAGEEGNSSGALVRSAVFAKNNTSLNQEAPAEVADLRGFAKKFPGDTAYAQKIRTIANKDYVSAKDVIVLSSAISAWRRYKDNKRTSQKAPAAPQTTQNTSASLGGFQGSQPPQKRPQTYKKAYSSAGEYVGAPGERLNDTKVKITYANNFKSKFGNGVGTMIIAKDEQGRTYKWNSSKEIPVKKDDYVSLRGLIQDHEEYNGIKQNIITRGEIDILSRAV